jgi:hypothetical protein
VRLPAAFAPLAIILSLAALGPVPSASAAAPNPGAVDISAAPTNFGDLSSGEDLVIVITIDNSTKTDIAAGTATVTGGAESFGSRGALYDWMRGSTNASLASQSLAASETPAIAAGTSQVIDVTVPAAAVPFGAAGVYPVGVALSGGGSDVGTARTAVAWNSASTTPVPIAIAAPLTVPTTGADTGANATFLGASALATYTAPDGILSRELDDLENTQVAIGIDPRILASIRILGKSAPQSAKDWLLRLESVSNDTFPLAWADADLTVALQAGEQLPPAAPPLDYAIDPTLFAAVAPAPTNGAAPSPRPTTNATLPPLPTSASLVAFKYTLPKLSWPAENSVTTHDLGKLAAGGINAAILSSSNVSRSGSTAQPGASAKIDTTTIAVSDSVLSEYLRGAVKSPTHAGWVAAMAKLVTSIDQIGLGSTPAPVMLATLDRNWLTTSDQLPHTLAVLGSQPWVDPTTLTKAIASTQTPAKVVNKPESSARVARVRAMLDAETQEVGFSVVAETPQALTSSRRLILLSLLSNEWSPNSTAWDTASAQFLADSQKIINSVQVVDSSNVLFLSDQSALPITVSNEFDQPVTVYIVVHPLATQLSVDPKYSRVKLTIEADAQHKAQIPISSLSNGKAEVSVTLYSPSGQQVGATKSINVNVQAGWETVGTVIFAVLVFALFGFGIFRNIRKRRKARASE